MLLSLKKLNRNKNRQNTYMNYYFDILGILYMNSLLPVYMYMCVFSVKQIFKQSNYSHIAEPYRACTIVHIFFSNISSQTKVCDLTHNSIT